MKTYVISDMHFNHHNICGEEGFVETRRRFADVDEMNAYLIKTWNKRVKPEDTVYHLGDFAMNQKPKDTLEILRKLNGTIIMVKGNHDSTKLLKTINRDEELRERVFWSDVGVILKQERKIIHLTHYPLIIGSRGNRVNLHGHIHEMAYQEPNLLNVGVDSPELTLHPFGTPYTIKECIDLIEEKEKRFNESGLTYTKHGTIE